MHQPLKLSIIRLRNLIHYRTSKVLWSSEEVTNIAPTGIILLTQVFSRLLCFLEVGWWGFSKSVNRPLHRLLLHHNVQRTGDHIDRDRSIDCRFMTGRTRNQKYESPMSRYCMLIDITQTRCLDTKQNPASSAHWSNTNILIIARSQCSPSITSMEGTTMHRKQESSKKSNCCTLGQQREEMEIWQLHGA